MAIRSCFCVFFLLVAFQSTTIKATTFLPPPQCRPVVASTLDRLEFLTNLIIYKTEFFLRGSIGLGIHDISPGLVHGPVPVGAKVAKLDHGSRNVIKEIGLTGIGHLRTMTKMTLLKAPIAMPKLNLSTEVYANFLKLALNGSTDVTPPLDIYDNRPVFLVCSAIISSLVQQYYVGLIPLVIGKAQQETVARIALNDAAGSGALRAQIYAMVNSTVEPYPFTVGELTNIATQLVNQLGGCGMKDEGLIVPLHLGAENRTTSNVVPADVNSLAFARTERELLRFVFGSGKANQPGFIFPTGLTGTLYKKIILLKLS